MPKKLKVFRTPIGFHDAYVAAPSQKAALEAWGADSNIFAQGIAEQVTDPKLMKAALDRPGEVIKVARGSAEAHLKVLGRSGKKDGGSRIKPGMAKEAKAPAGKRPPRPSRTALDKAEKALARAEERHRTALDKLRAEERALADRRRAIETRQREERRKLEQAAAAAEEDYQARMGAWADG